MASTAPDKSSSEKSLHELFEFIRFPSISTDPAHAKDMKDCARWLVKKFERMGLKTDLYDTPGHPVVMASNAPREGVPTVLIYGHYDVQPADPLELWDSPPFEPHVVNGLIYARGSTDNKGQIMAHICGVEAHLKNSKDPLPVNVVFLVEGEEEIGSPNLEKFLKEHLADLKCDLVVISDSSMIGKNRPALTYGLRGVAACEITLTGPSMDLHSGFFGGAVANPATALCRLVATVHDDKGKVMIEGFYDDVKPIEEWEKAAWANLPFGKELLHLTGSPAQFGEDGFSAVERTVARPTAEVNGLYSGYMGEGSKTIVPSRATAKFTFRLVPNQDPAKILKLAEKHFKKHCPPGVKLEYTGGHSGPPYFTDPRSIAAQAALRALEETFQAKPEIIREGGSIPIVQSFKEVLGVDTLLLGLAMPDCKMHSPNESFPIENFEAGIRLNQALLIELGKLKK